MKMLVTKLSKGKYANESQLFSEVISDDNVKLMGEMIALQALRNVLPYDFEPSQVEIRFTNMHVEISRSKCVENEIMKVFRMPLRRKKLWQLKNT